jgi:hypothetical protein
MGNSFKKKTCGSCNCNLALQPFAAPVCSQEDHVPPGHLLYELSDAMWWRCPSRASELRSCGQHDSDPLPKTGNSYMIHNSNQQYYRNCFIYIIITATNRFREREIDIYIYIQCIYIYAYIHIYIYTYIHIIHTIHSIHRTLAYIHNL